MPSLFPELNCNPWFCSPSLCSPSFCEPSSQQPVVQDRTENESLDDAAVDEDTRKEAGVGICFRRVKRDDGPVMRVVSLAADSPAREDAFVETGMILTHIDGISIADKNTREIGELILGPVGSQVKLRLASPTGPTREVLIRRKHLPREKESSSCLRDRAQTSASRLTQDESQPSWWSSCKEIGSNVTSAISPRSATSAGDQDSAGPPFSTPNTANTTLSLQSDRT